MPLTRKLLLALLLAAVVPLLVVVAVSSRLVMGHSEQMVGERLTDNVEQAARTIDQFMLNCLRDMHSFSVGPTLKTDTPDRVSQRLARLTYSYPYFGELMLADPRGVIIASSHKPDIGQSVFALFDGARDEIEMTLQRPAGQVFVEALDEAVAAARDAAARGASATNAELRLQFYAKVEDDSGRCVGVLVGDVVTRQLQGLVEDIDRRTPGDEHACLVNTNGLILATSDPALRVFSTHPDATAAGFGRNLAEGRNDYHVHRNWKGRKVMTGHAALLEYGANKAGNWRLITTAPYDAIMEPVRGMIYEALAAVLLTLVATIGIALWLARGLTRPVQALTDGVNTLASGDLSVRVPVRSRDEMGRLAEAFNQMVATIQEKSSAVRQSELRFRQLADTITEAFYVQDMDPLRVVYLSPGFERIWGVPCEKVIAHPDLWTQSLHPDDRERILRVVDEFYRGVTAEYEHEYRIVRPDGSVRWVHDRAFPLRHPGGRLYRIVGTAGDITGRKQAEEVIRQLNATLERRVEERTQQLDAVLRELESASYTISHDLRAPLRHVQGYVEMIKRQAADRLLDQDRRHLDTIAGAGRDMGLLVDGLLSFMQAGRRQMSETVVNLDELVRECVRNLEPATRGRNIVWKISPLPAVTGDPTMLKQVFAHLLDNAVKFTRPRDPAVVEVGMMNEEGGTAPADSAFCIPHSTFFVRDNGVGFDPQYVHKLFGVFQRLHTVDEFEGTGIGLANVRRIIARHGGRTWAEGKVGEGATFFFTLKATS